MTKLFMPYHYRVYRRRDTQWFVIDPVRVIFNGTNQPLDLQNIEQTFGLTDKQVVIELFRINGGRAGCYLANLRDRKYYYCGLSFEDVKVTLYSLGIGRPDPFDN